VKREGKIGERWIETEDGENRTGGWSKLRFMCVQKCNVKRKKSHNIMQSDHYMLRISHTA
jgi:hypothetical protein